MRKLLAMVAMATVVTGSLVSSSARAATPFVDGSTMFQQEAGWVNGVSLNGAAMSSYGVVNFWGGPFAGLPFAGHEYTVVFTGLTSQGTTPTCGGPLCLYHTNYNGGTFAIYDDVGPGTAANYCNQATFTDGTVLLSGVFNSFFENGQNLSPVGNFEGDVTFTGGTLLGLVANPGTGIFTGGTDRRASLLPVCVGGPQYVLLNDGKGDLNPPVPTKGTTWSGIKSQY